MGFVGMEKGFTCKCGMRVLSNVGLKANWSLYFVSVPNESSQLSAPPTPSLLPSSLICEKLSLI